jgi:hypothetical protein
MKQIHEHECNSGEMAVGHFAFVDVLGRDHCTFDSGPDGYDVSVARMFRTARGSHRG